MQYCPGAQMEDARKGVLMAKLKLTILNMKEFLHAVNECRGGDPSPF